MWDGGWAFPVIRNLGDKGFGNPAGEKQRLRQKIKAAPGKKGMVVLKGS